ncbi:MAG: caspase family protein [Myxococcota bacterium]|nr:caspase family protein [Myxococcota bacterium]
MIRFFSILRWVAIAAGLLCWEESATALSTEEPERFAIVIGVNQPDSEQRDVLRYADDDAIAMHRLLEQSGAHSRLLVSIDADSQRLHPELIPDDAPTSTALLDHFSQLVQQMQREQKRGKTVVFLLFYSGHGDVHGGQGYVTLEQSKLTRSLLFDKILSESPASQNHVIVDACKSNFLIQHKGPGGERRPYHHSFARKPSPLPPHTGFVLSASSGQNSHEWERYQAGVFSHEVRSGLRGGADADLNGQITYAELGAFLTTANKSIDNPKYRPEFLVLPPGHPQGNLSSPIVHWPASSETLTIDVPKLGHFYVEDPAGLRVLDVNPAYRQRLLLHLPKPRPLFVRKADESVEYSLYDTQSVQLSQLSDRPPMQIARKGALHLAFGQLFGVPFESTQVAHFEQQYRSKFMLAFQDISPMPIGERITLWTAGGSAAAGLATTMLAMQQKQQGKDKSQRQRSRINTRISRLNAASVTFYCISGAALASWLTLRLWRSRKVELSPVLTPEDVGLSASITFP